MKSKLEDINFKELYNKKVNSFIGALENFNLENYFNENVFDKIPRYLEKYVSPEKRYIKDLVSEIDPYFNGIKDNLSKNLIDDPKNIWGKSLDDIVFGSHEKRQEFSGKVYEIIEEINYASEVFLTEVYKIWNVKLNLPFIGNLVKRKFESITGLEDLPPFEKIFSYVTNARNQIYSVLDFLGFKCSGNFSREEIFYKYQDRMNSYGETSDSKRLSSYEIEFGVERPKNFTQSNKIFEEKLKKEFKNIKGSKLEKDVQEEFDSYRKKRFREREKGFIKSSYNSWWEKLISYIGYFFGL